MLELKTEELASAGLLLVLTLMFSYILTSRVVSLKEYALMLSVMQIELRNQLVSTDALETLVRQSGDSVSVKRKAISVMHTALSFVTCEFHHLLLDRGSRHGCVCK